MLNDLLAIERGLAAHGIASVGRHPDIKDVAKGWALRVRLADGGRVSSAEIITEAGNGAVWTLRDGQQNGFPGLKTAAGLLVLDAPAREEHGQVWNSSKAPSDRRAELLRFLSKYPVGAEQLRNWPNSGHRKRIAQRLEALRSLADNPLNASVPAAFERFLAALEASPSLLEQLTSALGERVRNGGDDWLEPIRIALIAPITLAIDVKGMEFQRDAGDARQIDAMSAALSKASIRPNTPDSGQCAFTGRHTKLHSGNFPEPNLPSQGQVKLFSKNPEVPSQSRYGLEGGASIAIAEDLLSRMAGALKSLTAQDLWNKTWRRVPGERLVTQNGKKVERWDLMIVSLPSAPDVPLAGDLAGDDDGDDDVASPESSFKELASRVTDQSRGKYEHDSPQNEVNVLIIRKIDKGNHKTVYHRKTTSADFWKAAQNWQAATVNTPDWLRLPFPGKAKAEVILRGPPYVKPLSITPISRVQFANGGRRPIESIGIPASQAFQLFLKEGDIERRARDLLHLLVERHGDLLAGVAAARTKGTEHLKDFDPKAGLRHSALRSATWIGALLYHLDRLKEVYMSDAGFRLGQLLAAADIVHVGYCKDVRDGSIPPTLLGNALLGMAAERPHDALKLLLKRWPPYAAWAQRKARWILREIEPIATDLRETLGDIQGRTHERFQAELLLGYMAGLPRGAKGGDDAGHAEGLDDVNKGEKS